MFFFELTWNSTIVYKLFVLGKNTRYHNCAKQKKKQKQKLNYTKKNVSINVQWMQFPNLSA